MGCAGASWGRMVLRLTRIHDSHVESAAVGDVAAELGPYLKDLKNRSMTRESPDESSRRVAQPVRTQHHCRSIPATEDRHTVLRRLVHLRPCRPTHLRAVYSEVDGFDTTAGEATRGGLRSYISRYSRIEESRCPINVG